MVGDLKGSANGVRGAKRSLIPDAVEHEHDAADRVGRQAAVIEKIAIFRIAADRHILAKGRDQIPKRLSGKIVGANRIAEREKNVFLHPLR